LQQNYPQISTLYEIITSEILTQPNPQVIKFVQSELKLLQKLILKDPKSYCLWYHRQWCIVEGIKKEEDIINSAIIKNEQDLCAMMLTKDERNFHCWSYKIWLLDTYCNEIKRRDTPDKEEILKDIYKKEYEQCMKIVNKNFMNYSGWFYLGKLYRYVFPDPSYEYSLVEQHIQMDLILKALYTDPKSEGLWSVFYWLVDVIRPISVYNYAGTQPAVLARRSHNPDLK
jgi:geranylgeranyl transferase type-2 subunit alpha